MKTTFLKPGIFVMVLLSTTIALFIPGCTGNSPTKAEDTFPPVPGAAKVSVTVGKVGILAKRMAIEMMHLVVTISVKETDSVVIADTSSLAGTGETTVSKTFPELTAPEDFVLSVLAIDAKGKTIHSGSKEFNTIPADTVDVYLNLEAKFSMLKVTFDNIPDSVAKVTLGIAGVDTLDSVFTTGSKEKLLLSYDYLEADTAGVKHKISLKASGSFYGNDTVLYAADTAIVAKSGVDSTYTVVLKWVGPDIPHGAAEITVTIGAVGTAVVNAGFGAVGYDISVDGLVAYYPFTGNAKDESGNGNDGVVNGATLAVDRFGNANSAYIFDGVNDFIQISNDESINFDARNDDFSYSLWVYITNPKSCRIIEKRDENFGNDNYAFYLGASDSICNCCLYDNVNNPCLPFSINWNSNWFNITVVVSTNKKLMFLYVNSILVDSIGYILTGTTKNNSPLFIGRQVYTNADRYYRGTVDDFRIYNRALTAAEIQALYHENGWTGN